MSVQTRRPLKTRESRWARRLAAGLAARGVRPNTVSVASVLFAALAGLALCVSPGENGVARLLPLLAAAACIQLRLLCNMVDGLIAVESGMGSPVGELFNDVPDRIADAFILVGAGVAVRSMRWGVTLGWMSALLAGLTAYIRVLGGSLGLPQSFAGPMAKQHRMFVPRARDLLTHRLAARPDAGSAARLVPSLAPAPATRGSSLRETPRAANLSMAPPLSRLSRCPSEPEPPKDRDALAVVGGQVRGKECARRLVAFVFRPDDFVRRGDQVRPEVMRGLGQRLVEHLERMNCGGDDGCCLVESVRGIVLGSPSGCVCVQCS